MRGDVGTKRVELGLQLRDDDDSARDVADRLHRLMDDPAIGQGWRDNALATYRRQWSRQVTNDRWDQLLRGLVAGRAAQTTQL